MAGDDLRYITLAEAAAMVKAKKVSPVELTASRLSLIDTLNDKLNAFITITREKALADARQAEQAVARGGDTPALLGVPIALKDLYGTKGIRTTANSRLLADSVPDEDATTTRLLAEAGSVLLGKLTMHEFAFGSPDFELPSQPARNPWNLDHQPGGSSSGSAAALAAGLCYGALGSDTGGSIRGPASLCGLSGLKPTYGRVSRHGVVPLSWSLDHAGPMARTVEDCALLLQVIAGYDSKDAASANVPVPDYTAELRAGVRGLRMGVAREWYNENDGTNPEVMAAFEESLKVFEGQGAILVDVDAAPFINARSANMTILLAEAFAYHEQTLKTRPEDLGNGMRSRVWEGAFYSAADYIQMQRLRTVIAAQMGEILTGVDVVLSPSSARPAEPFADLDMEGRNRIPNYSGPFNLTGLPAMSVPNGFSTSGLPLGLQIAGRAFDESMVLRVGQAHEVATSWHERHPEI